MASKKNFHKSFEKSKRKQQLQKNKTFKRSRGNRAPRQKHWDVVDDYEDIEQFERIMPLDERDRRRAVETHIKAQRSEDDAAVSSVADLDAAYGRVIEVSMGICRVEYEGEVLLCSLRGALTVEQTGFTNVVTIGDYVDIQPTEAGKGIIEAVMPRRNSIARPDPFYTHLQQLLVANVDQLLIVAAWRQPHIWTELIDRYLITAERNAITPVICVNKIDLADNLAEVDEVLYPYQHNGYHIIHTSATKGIGMKHLCEWVAGKVTVLAGLSGVGKSSLLAAIQPDFDLRVGAVNDALGQGRHTTTQSNMMSFGDGGYVIDTPGIREFGLYGLAADELVHFYPEFAEQAGQCRFADCTHLHEPGCVVLEAVEAGAVSQLRHHNYQLIRKSLKK